MIITCLGATLLAQFLGGALYSTILQRTLAKQEAEQRAQQAPGRIRTIYR